MSKNGITDKEIIELLEQRKIKKTAALLSRVVDQVKHDTQNAIKTLEGELNQIRKHIKLAKSELAKASSVAVKNGFVKTYMFEFTREKLERAGNHIQLTDHYSGEVLLNEYVSFGYEAIVQITVIKRKVEEKGK